MWQRLQIERLSKPTSVQIKLHRCSTLRYTMIANINTLTLATACRYNAPTYIQLLGLEIS